MRKALLVMGVGGVLWGFWLLLWRKPSPSIIASGIVFPLGIGLLLRAGKIALDYSLRVLRPDLWLKFFFLVFVRVALAIVKTSWAIFSGRASPAIVAVSIPFHSDFGRLLLLWAITVTPGTIALLVEEDVVYIHCLHRPTSPEDLSLTPLIRVLQRIWE